ncbi:MAG: M4 family metallopeptidase [Deltaproteobacteria bacterium]|nr:M4 family metallopeptidase [Deltaproteobacteria bacterium]
MKQFHRGVPVFGAETIVHMESVSGEVVGLSDGAARDIHVDTQPSLTADDAVAIARESLPCPRCVTAAPKAELFVLRHEGRDYLTWKIELKVLDGSANTALPVVFVDANAGRVVWSYNNLQTGTGNSLYSGNVTLNTYAAPGGSSFFLEDVATKAGTFNYNNGTSSKARFTDSDDVWESAVQRAGVDAQYGAVSTLRYYKDVHGRNGIDDNGGPAPMTSADGVTPLMTSGVHYSSGYNNAFWDGTQMTYGDGDGSTFTPLVSLDIVGHEMTHGVTEHTAGLIYSGESGALNESMSDVFGAMVERSVKGESAATWLLGEECYTPGNGNNDALRYFANTHLATDDGFTADDDPDHYSERYTGSFDNGGVHINSGIANHAFYLTAVGGTHHLGGSVVGIGADTAAAIWFKALTSYLTPSATFEQASVAFYHAAQELYGDSSVEAQTVLKAWSLVGVTADTEAPSVAITAPAAGATLSEMATVTVQASDNVAVKQVDLLVDGAVKASSTAAPFSLSWLTGTSGNGPHVLTVKAYDAKNNVGTSAAVNVVVNNELVPPVVQITAPVDGATVAGNTQVAITATDNVSVEEVKFTVDGVVAKTLVAAPYVFDWNTAPVANGSHTLTASARDKAGNVGTSAAITVTVNNPGVAVYDATFKAPRCATVGSFCDTNALVVGRGANVGPELNQPNTLSSSCADGTSGSFHSDESLDRVRIETASGKPFAPGEVVNVTATVWVFSASSNFMDVFYATDASAPTWVLAGTVSPSGSGLRTMTVPVILGAGATQAIRTQFRYLGAATACAAGGYNDRDDLVFQVQSGDTQAPVTTLLSPSNGASVTGVVNIEATATDNVGVTQMQILIDDAVVATITTPPFTHSWDTIGVPAGSHTIVARAKDAANNQGDAQASVTVTKPPAAKSALLVVGAEPLDSHDNALRSRLETQLGFAVTVKQGAASAASDANGKQLVFISESVSSGSVGTKFTSVAVPVVTTEPALFDDLGLVAGAWDVVMGATASQTAVQIVDASSPLAAGLTGTPSVASAATTVVWGVPNGNAKVVARVVGSATRAAIFAYEAGVPMAAGTAPARRVAFFANSTTPGLLNTAGWSLFDAAINWALGTASPPPANAAPTVNAGTDHNTTAGTTLTLVGQATDDGLPNPPGTLALQWTMVSGPQSPQWPQNDSTLATTHVRFDVPGSYVLRLTANDGALLAFDDVQVVVASPPVPGTALVVVGAVPLSAGDAALVQRLQTQHALTVVTKTADASVTADATGKALVLISETVASGAVNTKFTAVTVPVINLEPALQDDLGMTSTTWDTSMGSAASQTAVTIALPTHPLAGGLSGQPSVVTSGANFLWGQPSASAQIVATLVGAPTRATVYGYTAGAAMVSGTAPARRVGLFPTGGVPSQLNTNGWALFDAAVGWVK